MGREQMAAAEPASDDAAREMVEWFAQGWADPVYEQFCEHFLARMHHEVSLIQPLARAGVGHDAFRLQFARLFASIPDLHARVLAWGSAGETILIELSLEGTVGRRPIRWQTCDRLTIRNGLIVERRSYFDSAPVVRAITLRVWAWPGLLIAAARASARARRAAPASRARPRSEPTAGRRHPGGPSTG